MIGAMCPCAGGGGDGQADGLRRARAEALERTLSVMRSNASEAASHLHSAQAELQVSTSACLWPASPVLQAHCARTDGQSCVRDA